MGMSESARLVAISPQYLVFLITNPAYPFHIRNFDSFVINANVGERSPLKVFTEVEMDITGKIEDIPWAPHPVVPGVSIEPLILELPPFLDQNE